MRIARGNLIIGEWTIGQVKSRMSDASLVSTDLYYDEVTSDWLPLGGLLTKEPPPKPVTPIGRSCYCGSGLPFSVCHGDGGQY
jgi:hypothetical protein